MLSASLWKSVVGEESHGNKRISQRSLERNCWPTIPEDLPFAWIRSEIARDSQESTQIIPASEEIQESPGSIPADRERGMTWFAFNYLSFTTFCFPSLHSQVVSTLMEYGYNKVNLLDDTQQVNITTLNQMWKPIQMKKIFKSAGGEDNEEREKAGKSSHRP